MVVMQHLVTLATVMIVMVSVVGARPNIIVINMDDVGTDQFQFYGCDPLVPTPNIDAFEKEAVRFNNFFAQPLCGPSRGSLMSGRYPSETGIKFNRIARKDYSTLNVDRSECTIGKVFKNAGYDTALFGKVHNMIKFSQEEGQFRDACGFDMWHLWTRVGHRYHGANVSKHVHPPHAMSFHVMFPHAYTMPC